MLGAVLHSAPEKMSIEEEALVMIAVVNRRRTRKNVSLTVYEAACGEDGTDAVLLIVPYLRISGTKCPGADLSLDALDQEQIRAR